MMCQNNGNYMDDLYFYNQTPPGNSTYYQNRNLDNNFYNIPNNNFPYNTNNLYNQNPMYNNQFQNQTQFTNQQVDLTTFYPSIYKIIKPVAIKVIQTSNYRYLDEEVINNMTDTVYNIVEGDIERKVDSQITNNNVSNDSPQNLNNTNSPNSNYKSNDVKIQTTRNTNDNNEIVKDIIKIIIIKELINQNNSQMRPNNIGYIGSQFGMNIMG